MTKHSKNNTDGAVFTYAERREMDHGSQSKRLGRDSVLPFGCCCLSLMPSRDPVVTPEGYLYDRLAILENLMEQKKERKRAVAEHEEQKRRMERNKKQEKIRGERMERARFFRSAMGIESEGIGKEKYAGTKRARIENGAEHDTTRVMAGGVDVTGGLKGNFWLPTNTPQAEQSFKRPSIRTRCPTSGKPLRTKDLVSVVFTKNKEETIDEENNKFLYMCPVCYSTLSNSVKAAVLRTSGNVVCGKCVDQFSVPEKRDPVTSQDLDPDKDIIPLRSGGTGFAASGGESKTASKYRPSVR